MFILWSARNCNLLVTKLKWWTRIQQKVERPKPTLSIIFASWQSFISFYHPGIHEFCLHVVFPRLLQKGRQHARPLDLENRTETVEKAPSTTSASNHQCRPNQTPSNTTENHLRKKKKDVQPTDSPSLTSANCQLLRLPVKPCARRGLAGPTALGLSVQEKRVAYWMWGEYFVKTIWIIYTYRFITPLPKFTKEHVTMRETSF